MQILKYWLLCTVPLPYHLCPPHTNHTDIFRWLQDFLKFQLFLTFFPSNDCLQCCKKQTPLKMMKIAEFNMDMIIIILCSKSNCGSHLNWKQWRSSSTRQQERTWRCRGRSSRKSLTSSLNMVRSQKLLSTMILLMKFSDIDIFSFSTCSTL